MKRLGLALLLALGLLWLPGCRVPAICTQTLTAGANISSAIQNAPAGAVLCLSNGTYAGANLQNVNKSAFVTVQNAPGASNVRVGDTLWQKVSNLRFQGVHFTDGLTVIGASHGLQFLEDEFTGTHGLTFNGDDYSYGTKITDVLIATNNIHDIDYTGSQGVSNGYGITAYNGVGRFQIVGNTIKSVAADYIQTAGADDFYVDHNTILGPTLVGSHPQEHQDLWQIFGNSTNVTFSNNVARNTGTHESLLFQEGNYRNVNVINNLFDHDSRGYTCQIYESQGLTFQRNTIVGSRWGCLFRDDNAHAGSNYRIDHNIAVGTTDSSDFSFEGSRIDSWCVVCDYNVSQDGSAPSQGHSVRNWTPQWVNTTDYQPIGLPYAAGYKP